MEKISVIIPTYNKGGRLALTLKSFCYQDTKVPYEILLVDGGEEPNKEVSRFMSQIPLRVVRVENHGRSANRNAGIREAKGDLLIFCDDDLIVERSYIESHWQAHQATKRLLLHGRKKEIPYVRFFQDPRDPKAGLLKDYKDRVLSDTLMSFKITEEDVADNFDKIRKWGHSEDRLEKIVQYMFANDIERYEVPWLTADTANMSVPRSLAVEIGMFDEIFGLNWAPEDLEFGYRVYQAGGKFGQSEYQTDAYHLTHARTNWRQIAENGFRLFQKMYPEDSLIPKVAKVLIDQNETIDSLIRE